MLGYSPKSAANAYSKIDVETGVLVADPHKLILMLFDGAIVALINAKQQLHAGNLVGKGKSVAHAIAIIEHGLRASLNVEVGGELASNLNALYTSMVRQLLIANIKNDATKFDEINALLSDLRGAWQQIAPVKANAPSDVDVTAKPGYALDALAPRKSGYISA